MYDEFAQELAFCEYMHCECYSLGQTDLADYWEAKYYGLARGIEIATGHYPAVLCHDGKIDVHIGDYKAAKFFG